MSEITKITNSRGEAVGELVDNGNCIIAWGYQPSEQLAEYRKSDNTTRTCSNGAIISHGNSLTQFFFPVQHRAQ
jgi:hypothetical protein